MSSGGDDERRVKRKHDAPRDKQPPCQGGRIAGASRSVAAQGNVRDKGRRIEAIEEERLERASHTILPGACPDTPPHLVEFDGDYIVDYSKDVVERRPNDTRIHQVINYSKSQKLVEEATDENSYDEPKDLGLTTGFGMSSIPTSLPQSSSTLESQRL